MEIVSRERYLKKVENWIGKENVIVLTGQRRVGKSFVLKDFIRQHKCDANIIYVDKEKRQFRFLENGDQLGDYIEDRMDTGKHNIILVDEIQDIDGWEKPIRS